jgi:hypothetical protein
MVASLNAPADIVNAALVRIGYGNRLGTLFDGSRAAKSSLDIYAQTRDQLLRLSDWPFARRDTLGNVIKAAPPDGYVPPDNWNNTFPPLPWKYEYTYPDDCIKVLNVRPSQILLPNYLPRPNIFSIANDGGQRVILSDVANAIVVYTGQITDMTQWPADFAEALVAQIARRLAPLLANLDDLKLEAQDEQVETVLAEKQQG